MGIEVTVDEAYMKIGGWGRFQTFVLVITVLAVNSGGLIDNGIAYLELEPDLLCRFKSDPAN